MVWLTWRQFRVPALAVFVPLVVVAIALILSAPGLNREYAQLLAQCEHGCIGDAYDHFFFPHAGVYFGLNLLVAVVPVIAGVFWGAPLLTREYEASTLDVVWQQSVPRRRWLAVKVGLLGLAAIAAAAVAVFMVSWWARPLDATAITGLTRLSPGLFTVRGYVPLGYAAFAFSLGVAAGVLIRRTVPAMAVTLVVFVAAQILMPTLVRPNLATPVRMEMAITGENLSGVSPSGQLTVDFVGPSGAWVLTSKTVDAGGRIATSLPDWVQACATPNEPAGEAVQDQCLDRLAAEGYRQVVTYHPAQRFWRFQAIETAIFGGLSLLLIGLSFLRIRPR